MVELAEQILRKNKAPEGLNVLVLVFDHEHVGGATNARPREAHSAVRCVADTGTFKEQVIDMPEEPLLLSEVL